MFDHFPFMQVVQYNMIQHYSFQFTTIYSVQYILGFIIIKFQMKRELSNIFLWSILTTALVTKNAHIQHLK